MTVNDRLSAFHQLGQFLKDFLNNKISSSDLAVSTSFSDIRNNINTASNQNPWFTADQVNNALKAIADQLAGNSLSNWIDRYIKDKDIEALTKQKRIAVIMAGNIPLVGFHDFLCVLLSGNKLLAKLSSEDKVLLPFLSKVLTEIEPRFASQIEFTDKQIKNMDAVIATGSNNTGRYFEYYFGKYPCVIRKNRNSVAVLTGKETTEELRTLGKDIFCYYGLGCRNVSKLYVPQGYQFNQFFESVLEYKNVMHVNRYVNNYEYNRAVYLINNDKSLLDNNFLLLKESEGYSSPIGVLFYEFYSDKNQLNDKLKKDSQLLQCVVSIDQSFDGVIAPGTAQCPQLNDYADGIDTMEFLISLK